MKKRKSLGRWIASVIAFFVVVALVAVGALWWANHNRYHVEAAEPLREAQSAVKPAIGDSGSVPDVRAAVAKAAKDPALGRLSAAVTDVQTGKMLWSADPQRPLVPASSTKVLTAAAAVLALQGDQRQSTKVLHDGKGNLTIVSDGDVTLSSGKGESLYTQPGKISDLAKQVQDKLGSTTVASITVDNSAVPGMFSTPRGIRRTS
nr:D-alanyl-D-alanine carboxypeptidase [Corynebacterium auriscanis]